LQCSGHPVSFGKLCHNVSFMAQRYNNMFIL
jgi:hypothetical protein